MPYCVLELKADGRIIKTIQPKKPSYDQNSKAVDGYIETIPYLTKLMHEGVLYNRGTAFANEEGWIKSKPLNRNATAAWRFSCPQGDPKLMALCGDVIFYSKIKEEK